MFMEIVKSALWGGSRWPAHILNVMLSSPAPRPLLFWLIAGILVVIGFCLIFHLILRAISKTPLLNYFGLPFGNIKLSPLRVKLTLEDIELLPSRSSLLQSIILSIFPSAIVHRGEKNTNYPESKVRVKKLSIKIRISSFAGPTQDHDLCTTSSFRPREEFFDAGVEGSHPEDKIKPGLKSMYYVIPRIVIIVKLTDVSIEIEKAYLAPEPPSQFYAVSLASNKKLPAALPPLLSSGDFPTFLQESLLETINNAEVAEAEKATLFVERWIDHVVTKMKRRDRTSSVKSFGFTKGQKTKEFDPNVSSEESEGGPTKNEAESGEACAEQRTYNEKMNAWIQWAAEKVLHLISFEVKHMFIIISGASSEYVKKTRKLYSRREANLHFARLPHQRRALTVVGADAISLSFSPDKHCNALFSFVGLHTKVGNPVQANQAYDKTYTLDSATDAPYAWLYLAHPFHLVAELQGILPFIIWAVNYDHYWPTKSLGLSLSSTEISFALAPDHLHTVLLHLDDYTDPMSSYNEWLLWLKDTHFQTLQISEHEKVAYIHNYARTKGVNAESDVNSDDSVRQLTSTEIKDMERRMTRYEIMSLRCFAMKDYWRIPKGNKELTDFLLSSRSSICHEGNDSCSTPDDVPTPFQRHYPTPLHALVTLIRENSSLLSSHVTVECFTQIVHIDFCHDGFILRKPSSMPSIPSSITVSGLSFDVDQTSTLFLNEEGILDLERRRPFLDLTLHICTIKWDVVENTASSLDEELPFFRGGSFVGMIYMQNEDIEPSKHILSLGLTISVTPTTQSEQHFALTFETSNLVIVVNPLPLLAAIRNLIELSDLPFQSTEEITPDLNEVEADERMYAHARGIEARINVNVKNTQLLFLIDRRRVSRGILNLHVYGINIEVIYLAAKQDRGLSAKLSFSTEPVILCAGQVSHDQSFRDGKIDCLLMPFQPIVDVDGANFLVLAKEYNLSKTETSQKPDPKSAMTTVKLNIEFGTESFLFNASPSTIVAMFGVLLSLDPILDWAKGAQNAKEEERTRVEIETRLETDQQVKAQRQVLLRIFQDIDVDGSGELSEEELESVILELFDKSINEGAEDNEKVKNIVERPTMEELKRECDYLLSIIDQNRTDEITFSELDTAFYRLVNKIDDTHLTPTIKDDSEVMRNSQFKRSDEFLSGPWLRKLVYFDDIREFSSTIEVFRVTGWEGLENGSAFPVPSLWHQGDGIERFWDLYTRETGCTRHSLNGQNISLVQRKLVRSLCNYEFAKFCWKALVQPGLYAASEVDGGRDITHWVLDKDSRARIKSGIIERLLKHVHTEVIKETKPKGDRLSDIQYDACVVAAVNCAVLSFGSSHRFANPLLEARFCQVKINASTLMSSETGFVPEKESIKHENGDKLENCDGNHVYFQSNIKCTYLNTKHNHMEYFIEPYTCFGSVMCKVFPQDSNANHGHEDTDEASHFSIHLNCPRFLNINTSRSFFETASVLTKVMSQSDPETFRTMIFERDCKFIRNFWDTRDKMKSGVLSCDETLQVMNSVTEMHWKDEMAGLSPNEKHHFLLTFCNLADKAGDGIIRFDNLIEALKLYTSRSYFSGSKELLLKNSIGRELKVTTKDYLEDHLMHHSIKSESDYQHLLSTAFLSIGDGNSRAFPLSEKMSLVTHGYKIIDDLSVSPYQIMMFPLKRKKKGSQRKRRSPNASGFSPFLTVVPKSDSLDSVSLDVRTSVHICTEIPIQIRIVRIGKSAGIFRRRGAKSHIDLTKKNLMAALRRVVEGAPIVYEKSGLKEGVLAPLPLDVLDSSHYHALLIEWNNSWRDPVLLTKDFLFNPMNIRQVARCHALSGVVITKERLNVHLSDKLRNRPIASDTKRSILRRTAWDTTIQVVPFFLLSNSLPFPIVVRSWQTSNEDDDDSWDEPLIPASVSANKIDQNSSSDEDISYMTPSIRGRKVTPDDIHLSSGYGNSDRFSQDHVAIGQVLRLSGVRLGEPLFIQVSHQVSALEEANFMWTCPMRVDLPKMRTGINQKGKTQLPKLILDLGDNCDCLVDVTVESGTRVPMATIYSPFFLMNKTGTRLEYRVAGKKKSYLDSGFGGLPIMIHGSQSQNTNEKYRNVSRSISVIPVESPNQAVAQNWWDESANGVLVLPKSALEEKGQSLVDWSDKIDLDAAGTSGEINCKQYIFNVQIESLAGAFHRSNLISFTPRFVVKNMLHIAISLLPIFGGIRDAIRKASQLRQGLREDDHKRKLDLAPGESTVLFSFHNTSRGIETPYKWVTFCVHASRLGASFKSKWHLIPVDLTESLFFGEHDGCYDTMCGILEGKVHSSDTGSRLVSITHAEVPPFQIENRSSTHYIRFVQEDHEAVVFEIPPMSSAAYTWDSPLGKKKLRAVVIPKAKSKKYQLENALKLERDHETLQGKGRDDEEADGSIETFDNDDESIESETVKEPLLYSLKKGVRPDATDLNKTERYRSPRKMAVFSLDSRSYDMLKVGKQKRLPCPSAKESASGIRMMSSHLVAHIRILAGTKILSFSDSTWLADQVQAGILRKGGDFKSALFDLNVEGFGLYIMDDYPREVMAVVVRDIQLHKQMGSIETTARVRHFQVDAMLPNARYPIIIQPLPMGVDRRDLMIVGNDSIDLIVPENIDKRDCFWMKNDEKPVPVFEAACSYVPQVNMTWVPSLHLFICPLQMHIDVDYILRIFSMIVNSIFKYKDDMANNLTARSSANDQLKFITRGQLNICMCYVEKLHIDPVHFDIELNIKSDNPDDDEEEGDSNLMLHSIAQTTNSAAVASILSWVINVGANFAHVSPTFRYSHETHTDQYCDIVDLLSEIARSYIVQTIKQSYKVIFSMQLIGDPSHWIHQCKTGVTDLFSKTHGEVVAGGKDGLGKGVTSLIQNVGGGTFFMIGKMFGGFADTIDSLTTNATSSNHLKPKSASSDGRHPDNAILGVVEGTKFAGKTITHGFAGLIGNPYRGAKTGSATGVAKGVASGVTGLIVAPIVGALGFVAKTADGIGATTRYLDLGVIEARCRPARMVPWGRPMSNNGLSFLKAIGIRVHTVRYQKIRRRITEKDDTDHNGDIDHVTSKEYKRIRAAEERRKSPPLKLVSIMHDKEKYHYITTPIRPKLLSDAPGNLVLSHYAVTFEETLILRSSDLQLGDVVAINFWNYRGLKATSTRAKPLGIAKFTVGDIYSSVLQFYREQLRRKESNLTPKGVSNDSLIIPAPQECALFRPCKKESLVTKDIFEAINEELAAIKKSEEDIFLVLDSDSSKQSDSDSSFLDGGGKTKSEDRSTIAKSNERLFGSISLSFCPIPW